VLEESPHGDALRDDQALLALFVQLDSRMGRPLTPMLPHHSVVVGVRDDRLDPLRAAWTAER
jgi:hypothetical protein